MRFAVRKLKGLPTYARARDSVGTVALFTDVAYSANMARPSAAATCDTRGEIKWLSVGECRGGGFDHETKVDIRTHAAVD